MAKRVNSYKDMNGEALERYLEVVEDGVHQAQDILDGYRRNMEEAWENGNMEAANMWQMMLQAGEMVLSTGQLWAFKR